MSLNPARPQRVGNLRDRIVWQEKLGDDTWIDRQTEPARIEPLKGSEKFDQDTSSRYATASHKVFTRYRHVSNTGDWRLLWVTGHQIPAEDAVTMVPERLILDIESVANVDERRRFLEIVVTNTDSASAPEIVVPPSSDGQIGNSGNPFTSTDGWAAVNGTLSVSGTYLRLGTSGFGDAITEISTTIGADYRFTVNFASTWGDTILIASNDASGWPWVANSDPVGESDVETDGTFTLDFTATAETTYLLFEGPTSEVIEATCEKLP